eukprot:166798-Amphidinium_carterae.1
MRAQSLAGNAVFTPIPNGIRSILPEFHTLGPNRLQASNGIFGARGNALEGVSASSGSYIKARTTATRNQRVWQTCQGPLQKSL